MVYLGKADPQWLVWLLDKDPRYLCRIKWTLSDSFIASVCLLRDNTFTVAPSERADFLLLHKGISEDETQQIFKLSQ